MRGRILSTGLLAFLLPAMFTACKAKKDKDCYSSCGNISNISFPFRLKDDPDNCGYPEYQLSCESNRTVLYLGSMKFWVEAIEYKNQTIRVVDAGLQSDDCSSLPRNSVNAFYRYFPSYTWFCNNNNTIFVNCSSQMMGKYSDSYIATTSCSNFTSGSYIYVLGRPMTVSELHPSCKVVANTLANLAPESNYTDIHDSLIKGFELSWKNIPLGCRDCLQNGSRCIYDEYVPQNYYCYPRNVDGCKNVSQSWKCFLGIFQRQPYSFFFRQYISYDGYTYQIDIIHSCMAAIIVARTTIGMVCLIALLVYKLRRRHIWMDTTVEVFLSKYRCQTPTRYSYSDIRRMTMRFKEKLGQGGFGSVYKGKLRNGRPIAIKILSGKSKDNGQDFINEVATIGRIHHVNVVRLIGFCAEGSKRALIYEFMPNGSLEKYIYSHEGKSSPLSWEKTYQIALGIARGIQYLHQGCDMKILHFDIKPHNILLDDKFNPKVSDFGLSKFHPTNESHLSVTAVGGSLGYMAPELFNRREDSRHLHVSHKADVYSFGMLLMEMAGRRKNINAFAKNESQIYLPLWIYDQLDQGGDMGMEDAAEDEKVVAKKMTIVALWCIQMIPTKRPSMSKVIEMLEGGVELLQMPDKPFYSSPKRIPDEDHATDTNPTESSSIQELESLSGNYEESSLLDVIID